MIIDKNIFLDIGITSFSNGYKFLQISSKNDYKNLSIDCPETKKGLIFSKKYEKFSGIFYYRVNLITRMVLKKKYTCKLYSNNFTYDIAIKSTNKVSSNYISKKNQIKKINSKFSKFLKIHEIDIEQISNKNLNVFSIKENVNEWKTLSHNEFKYKLNGELRKYNNENLNGRKVYLSLTTNPDRIRKIHIVLRSLNLDIVENIFLIIPRNYRNNANLKFRIPSDLIQDFPKLKLLETSIDVGPISKILPTVMRIKNSDPTNFQNSIFIAIDDDLIYTKNVIDSIVYNVLKTNSAITQSSWGILDSKLYGESYMHDSVYNLNGFSAIGFFGKHFNINELLLFHQFAYFNNIKSCFQSDDMILSYFIRKNGVKILRINQNDTRFYKYSHITELDSNSDLYALHLTQMNGTRRNDNTNANHKVKYYHCYTYILNFFGF